MCQSRREKGGRRRRGRRRGGGAGRNTLLTFVSDVSNKRIGSNLQNGLNKGSKHQRVRQNARVACACKCVSEQKRQLLTFAENNNPTCSPLLPATKDMSTGINNSAVTKTRCCTHTHSLHSYTARVHAETFLPTYRVFEDEREVWE